MIKDVKDTTPLNVAWVTVKQWDHLLLEKDATHIDTIPDSPAQLIPTKLEDGHPGVDFSGPYSLSRTFGLSPDHKSFLFKLMQSLLPTRDRLARLRKVNSSDCTMHHTSLTYLLKTLSS